MNSLKGAVRRRWHIADAAVSRDGMTISGLDWGGDGPIALLQHANGFCAASLAPLAQLLRRHYRVIAIDARGHGDSGQPPLPEGVRWKRFADDLAATARQILDETGRERIDYGIGSSFGGTCTAIAEARHPNTFARIAMLDPPVRPNEAWLKKMGLDPAVARSDGPGLAEQAKKRRESWPSREAVRHAWKDKPTFQSWTPEAFELYLNEGLQRPARRQRGVEVSPGCGSRRICSKCRGNRHVRRRYRGRLPGAPGARQPRPFPGGVSRTVRRPVSERRAPGSERRTPDASGSAGALRRTVVRVRRSAAQHRLEHGLERRIRIDPVADLDVRRIAPPQGALIDHRHAAGMLARKFHIDRPRLEAEQAWMGESQHCARVVQRRAPLADEVFHAVVDEGEQPRDQVRQGALPGKPGDQAVMALNPGGEVQTAHLERRAGAELPPPRLPGLPRC